ncbi:MAG: hypothetical protein RIE52_00795 [Balneola sp.]
MSYGLKSLLGYLTEFEQQVISRPVYRQRQAYARDLDRIKISVYINDPDSFPTYAAGRLRRNDSESITDKTSSRIHFGIFVETLNTNMAKYISQSFS